MKKILVISILSILLISSCTIEYHGTDGESFFKLNWMDEEPYYVDPGNVVPNNFMWDTYYKTYGGFYTVYYEYQYSSRFGPVVYPNEIEIEVFENEAYGSDDGDDVYFELVLYPDGYFDYEHVIDYKNERVDVKEKTKVKVIEQTVGNKKVRYTYYKLPSRKLTE